MSLENFLSYLQQLLTMVNPKDSKSVELAQNALSTTIALAVMSGKIDALTHRAMMEAKFSFKYLVENAKDFAGKPGEYATNKQKRRRLAMMFRPGC